MRTIAAALLSIPLCLPSAGRQLSAAGLGEEWKAVDAQAAKIMFRAADVSASQIRFLRTRTANHSADIEVGIWSAAHLRHGRALVVYRALLAGYHLRSVPNIDDLVEGMKIGQENDLDFGPTQRSGNRLGLAKTQTFSFSNVDCVGFVQHWGSETTDNSSHGNRLLYGYFCADPGVSLEDTHLQTIRDSIGIRGHKEPEAVSIDASFVSAPIDDQIRIVAQLYKEGSFTPEKGTIDGILQIDPGGSKGRLELNLQPPYGNCSGDWRYGKGKYDSPDPPTGTWSVTCENGIGAEGTYRSSTPGRGQGSGELRGGPRIRFTYGG